MEYLTQQAILMNKIETKELKMKNRLIGFVLFFQINFLFPVLSFLFFIRRLFFCTVICLAACSSVPKGPVETFTIRKMTENQLEMANKELDRGNYEKALEQLGEARRMAVSIDDPSQLIRTSLAYSNIYFYLGQYDEAVQYWKEALAEAELSGETELAALTRIYQIRAQLLNKEIPASDVPALIEKELSSITKDRLGIALGWTVTGLAEKELAHWDEAEAALRKALKIHEQDRYLEQAAYDYYLIASVYSVSGRYDDAVESLHLAIAFDRRSENSYGLAMDWFALGEVYKKAGRSEESNAAYTRSENIKNSMQ